MNLYIQFLKTALKVGILLATNISLTLLPLNLTAVRNLSLND